MTTDFHCILVEFCFLAKGICLLKINVRMKKVWDFCLYLCYRFLSEINKTFCIATEEQLRKILRQIRFPQLCGALVCPCTFYFCNSSTDSNFSFSLSVSVSDRCSCPCNVNSTMEQVPRNALDVVFVMDKRVVRHQRNYTWLSTLVTDYIEPHLLKKGVGKTCFNRYSMALFHAGRHTSSNDSHANYLKHNVSSTLMTASEFDIFASALTNFEESTPLITADHGCEAMMDALRKLPFRKCPSIAENILLFTDKDGEQACFPHEEDYIKMRETLSGHGFTLNVIIDRRLGNISGNPVLGIDAHHTAFVLTKPNRKNWMAKVGFPIVINRTKRRSYVRLAMELGGGVWDINAVTHSEKARLAFADVLATGVHKQMQTCRLCTCQSDASYHCSLQYVRRTLNKEGKIPAVRRRC